MSYTNESYDVQAFRTLDQWLSIKYPQIYQTVQEAPESLSMYKMFERATALYLEAARQNNASGKIDADVQVGLGLLFYNSGQYDKAVDCFNTALQVRPNVWKCYFLTFNYCRTVGLLAVESPGRDVGQFGPLRRGHRCVLPRVAN